MTTKKALVGIAIVVVAVLGVSAWAFWPRSADEISERAALASYQQRSRTSGTTERSTVPRQRVLAPSDGVYRYHASGHETTKFGPLPAQTNQLPDSLTGVVVTKGRSCYEFTLNLFEQHTEDSTFCNVGDEFSLTTYAKHETVGVVTATAKITCDPGVFIGPDPTSDLDCAMKLEGGPFPVDAEFTGTSKVSPTEFMKIAEQTITVLPVEVTFRFSGKITGSWTEKIWFTEDRLPARIDRTLHMSGPASFGEDYDLRLASLTPTT